jgi:3-hydroxybutyryl-CoA dehydrogenase
MRTIAQIANAAGDAVQEMVADEAGIDTALRFGANYPFGPFNWVDRVGRRNVVAFLAELAVATGEAMYAPAQYLRHTSLQTGSA